MSKAVAMMHNIQVRNFCLSVICGLPIVLPGPGKRPVLLVLVGKACNTIAQSAVGTRGVLQLILA